MRKELSPVATALILVVVVGAIAMALSYQWKNGGKDHAMSAADAMKAGREQAKKDAAAKGLPPPVDPPAKPKKEGAGGGRNAGQGAPPPGAIPTNKIGSGD